MKYISKILNINALIAVLVGTILLLVSHLATKEHSFWQVFTHELGFAAIVAVLIWMSFEVFNSAQTEEEWQDRIEGITKSGLFRRSKEESARKIYARSKCFDD